jgi:hypothetical protein
VLAEEKHASAFLFLNAAAFATSWPVLPEFSTLSGPEKRILRSPLVGPYHEMVDVIQEIYDRLGRDGFLLLYEAFLLDRARPGVESLQTCEAISVCLDSFGCASPDEFFLYDPGVGEEAAVSEEKSYAPFSEMFEDMIRAATNLITTHEKLIGGKLPITNDPTRNLTVAVRMGNGELARLVFAAILRAKTAGVVDYALMYKAAMMGIVDVEIVVKAPIPQGINQAQKNVLLFMKHFVPPLLAKHAK